MKRTNAMIFQTIQENGFISKSDLQLLKNRSNKEQKDQMDYNFMESFGDGYGIPVSAEQGMQGLKWLLKFVKKGVYGYRELNILETARPSDFRFRGFYDAGNGWRKNFLPVYELNGMEYIPMAKPYIVG